MTPETIRELLAAFQALGGEAKEAFIWYLAIQSIPSFLLGCFWAFIGLVAVRGLLRHLVHLTGSAALMQAFGVTAFWSADELTRACDALRAARNKSR